MTAESTSDRQGPAQALLVHAYVDGELDAAAAIAVKERIDADPELEAEVGRVVALKQALRDKLHPETVAPAFRARIEALAPAQRPSAAPSWRALAASVALAVVLSSTSTWLVLGSLNQGVLDQAVDSHIRAMITGHSTDVTSTDQHIVKPWFNDKLASAPTVVDLRDQGFPLAGARIDVIAGKPVATLVFGRRLHSISLFERPGGASTALLPTQRTAQGLNVVGWSDDDNEYWAVSDLNAKELADFADLFRKAIRR